MAVPSEPSARARVHLAPSKCYWPRRIPAPLGVNPQLTAASQAAGDGEGGGGRELSVASATPPQDPQQGVGGALGAASGGVSRGRSPPPRRGGRGCYMTRHGRRWAGTHRGCDSCCGYNRELGEGGVTAVCAASGLPVCFFWGGGVWCVWTRHPGARSPRRGKAPHGRGTETCVKNTRRPEEPPAPRLGTLRAG